MRSIPGMLASNALPPSKRISVQFMPWGMFVGPPGDPIFEDHSGNGGRPIDRQFPYKSGSVDLYALLDVAEVTPRHP